MKILIVGSGVVGLHLLNFLKRYNFKMQVHISNTNNNKLFQMNLFGSYHPIYRDAIGGFSNYWHKVFDLKGINNKFLSNNLLFLNNYLNKQYEFIPYFKMKILNNILNRKNFKPQATDVVSSDNSSTTIRFSDKSIENYDYVFICHGALPPSDILVNSGLAKLSGFISDHLIGETKPMKSDKKLKIQRIGLHGFLRPYKILKINNLKVKQTIRPHFGKNSDGLNNSIIYSGSDFKALVKLLKSNSLNLILNACSTRYGFPLKSLYYKSFVQINAANIYKYYENKIFPIEKRYKENTKKLEDFKINGNLKSAIHYHNTYSFIEKSIANRIFDRNKTLILISPQFNYAPSIHHFTADLLSISENIAHKLLENK